MVCTERRVSSPADILKTSLLDRRELLLEMMALESSGWKSLFHAQPPAPPLSRWDAETNVLLLRARGIQEPLHPWKYELDVFLSRLPCGQVP